MNSACSDYFLNVFKDCFPDNVNFILCLLDVTNKKYIYTLKKKMRASKI